MASRKIKSVCIVGAGPAGLVALKTALESNSEMLEENTGVVFEPIVFEQSYSIGGVWNYDENTTQTLYNNPMYSNLRANLPKQIMSFLDFPLENYENAETYPTQQDVYKYLNKYADAFQLRNYITCNRKVTAVKPIFNDGSPTPTKWAVTVQNTLNNAETWNFEYDSVIICIGTYQKEKFPENYEKIRSIFKGEMLHSAFYKVAEKFRDKTVLLVGGNVSGRDLAVDLSRVAKQVYLSFHNFDREAFVVPEQHRGKLSLVREIEKATNECSVLTKDGVKITCDVIIFCTGFQFSFPFLEPGILEVTDGGKQVTPLYMHFIHRKFPTLCILGVSDLNIPFLHYDCQTRYYFKYLRGEITLPTESEMMDDYNQEQAYRRKYGLDGPKSHVFYTLQYPYWRKLAAGIGNRKFTERLEGLLPTIEKILFSLISELFANPFTFKSRSYAKILEDGPKCIDDPIGLNIDIQKDHFEICKYVVPAAAADSGK